MARPTNEALGITDITQLFNHQRRSYRTLSRLFHSGARVTTRAISQQIDMSEGTVHDCVHHFKEAGLICIDSWVKSELHATALVPVYRLGNEPDAPRPTPKYPDSGIRSKQYRDRMKQEAANAPGMTEQDTRQFFLSMMHALVPKKAA